MTSPCTAPAFSRIVRLESCVGMLVQALTTCVLEVVVTYKRNRVQRLNLGLGDAFAKRFRVDRSFFVADVCTGPRKPTVLSETCSH